MINLLQYQLWKTRAFFQFTAV